jgi:hypothetical protein
MFKNNQFIQIVHMEHGGTGSGMSPDDAKPIAAGVMYKAIDGVVITDAEVQVQVAVAGTTAMNVGDAGDPDGYVAAANVTLATPGGYVGAGVLLKKKLNATAEDILLAVTGASSAGKMALILRGYRI